MSESLVIGKADWFFDYAGLKKLSDEDRARGEAQKKHQSKLADSKKQQKKAVKRSAAQVEADALRLEIDAARAALEPYRPVSDAAVQTIETALNDSKTQDAETALKTLKACNADKLVEKAKSAFDKGKEKAAKAFPDLFKLQAEREAAIAKAGDVLTAAQQAKANADCRAATAPVVANPDAPLARKAQVALGEAYDAFDTVLLAAKAAQEDAITARKRAVEIIASAEKVLSPAQLALPGARLKAGEALMTGKDFLSARDAFGEAASVLEDELKADKAAQDDWAARAKKLPALEKTVAGQADWFTRHAKNGLLDARGSLAAATEGLASLAQTPPRSGSARSFPEAVNLVQQIEDQIANVKDAIDNYKAFRTARDTARDEVAVALAKAQAALQVAGRAIEKTDLSGRQDDGYVPGTNLLLDGFAKRLDDEQKAWTARLAAASDLSSLRANDAVSSLDAITTELGGLSGDPKQLNDSLQRSAAASAKSRLAESASAAEAELDALALIDLDAALLMQAELAGLRKRGDGAKSRDAVDRVCTQVEELRDRAKLEVSKGASDEDALEVKRAALLQRIAELDQALADRWKQIEKVSNNAEQKSLIGLHNSYSAMLETQRAMAGENQAGLLDACDEALSDLESLVDGLKENFGAQKALSLVRNALPFKVAGTSIADLTARIGQLTSRLDAKDDVKIFAGNTVFALKERLDALGKSLGTQTPAKVAAQLDAIENEIATAKAEAAAARKEYDKLKLQIEAAKKQLDGTAVFELVPNLRDQLKTELAAVRAAARQQGGPSATVLADMAALQSRIANPGKTASGKDVAVNARGVPVTMEQQETELIEGQKLFEIRKAAWEKKAELLRADIKSMRGDDSAMTKDMLKRLAEAGKAFKTLDDEGVAETMMSAIRQQCERVDANPDGLKVHARNKLPQTKTRWRNAVAYFRKGTDDLGKMIAGMPDPDFDDSAKTAVAAGLTRVNALFNAALFDEPVGRILAEKAEDAEKAAAREDALRELRRVRAVLDEDGRLIALSRATSFSPGLGAQLSELRLSLADLEQNLLVSL